MPKEIGVDNPVSNIFRCADKYILCIRVVSSTQFDGMILSGAGTGELVTDILFSSCINLGKIDYAKALPIVTEDIITMPLSKYTQPVEDIAEIVNVGLRLTGDSASLRVISNIIRIYEACKDNPNYSVKELVKDIKD